MISYKKLTATVLFAIPLALPAQDVDSEAVKETEVARKAGYHTSDGGFSGPASVPSQLDQDDILKDPVYRFPGIDAAFEGWTATKKRYNEEQDFQFGFDYNIRRVSVKLSVTKTAVHLAYCARQE